METTKIIYVSATKNDAGKKCVHCGATIYYIKGLGPRCRCDDPHIATTEKVNSNIRFDNY